MYKNLFTETKSNFDLAGYGIRITNFIGVNTSATNVPTTLNITQIDDYLNRGFAGRPTNAVEIWSSVANVGSGSPILKIQESSTLLLRYAHAGDANFDGKVDINDLYILASHWNPSHTGSSSAKWTDADFTGDGWVDADDLAVISAYWQYGV